MAVFQSLDALAAYPSLANTPELYTVAGTNFTNVGYAFPSAGAKQLYWQRKATAYTTGNLSLAVYWMSRAGSTSGNVVWSAAVAAVTPNDAQSVETKAFATASTSSAVTVNSTAKGLSSVSTVTISNLDSLATDDLFWIKLSRGTDTMSGDAILLYAEISYS